MLKCAIRETSEDRLPVLTGFSDSHNIICLSIIMPFQELFALKLPDCTAEFLKMISF